MPQEEGPWRNVGKANACAVEGMDEPVAEGDEHQVLIRARHLAPEAYAFMYEKEGRRGRSNLEGRVERTSSTPKYAHLNGIPPHSRPTVGIAGGSDR